IPPAPFQKQLLWPEPKPFFSYSSVSIASLNILMSLSTSSFFPPPFPSLQSSLLVPFNFATLVVICPIVV
ncbi:hypothetical protein KAW55_08045, partial [bacterium]|nr:hypothetical protein [bacterium]